MATSSPVWERVVPTCSRQHGGLRVRGVRLPVGSKCLQNGIKGASLVAQWLRIRLPVQGTRVRALVREDPTCRGATKPVHHNY